MKELEQFLGSFRQVGSHRNLDLEFGIVSLCLGLVDDAVDPVAFVRQTLTILRLWDTLRQLHVIQWTQHPLILFSPRVWYL